LPSCTRRSLRPQRQSTASRLRKPEKVPPLKTVGTIEGAGGAALADLADLADLAELTKLAGLALGCGLAEVETDQYRKESQAGEKRPLKNQ